MARGACSTPPAIRQAGVAVRAPGRLRHVTARPEGFGQQLQLLLFAPTATAFRPRDQRRVRHAAANTAPNHAVSSAAMPQSAEGGPHRTVTVVASTGALNASAAHTPAVSVGFDLSDVIRIRRVVGPASRPPSKRPLSVVPVPWIAPKRGPRCCRRGARFHSTGVARRCGWPSRGLSPETRQPSPVASVTGALHCIGLCNSKSACLSLALGQAEPDSDAMAEPAKRNAARIASGAEARVWRRLSARRAVRRRTARKLSARHARPVRWTSAGPRQ